MKLRIGYLLISLLITLIALPAFAASTHNATGAWLVEIDPGQSLNLSDVIPSPLTPDREIELNDLQLAAVIYQDGDSFTIETEALLGVEALTYDTAGQISDSQYIFDDALTYRIGLEDVFEVELSLTGFNLSSDHDMYGEFLVNDKAITFSGTKEAVPVPAAVWMLGSGMVALFGLKRRRS